MTIIQSLIILGSVGILAGLLLVLAYNKLRVKEDPKVEKMMDVLPGGNCGACGYASCHEFAIAVSKGDTSIDECRVGGAKVSKNLARIMGKEHQEEESEKKAVIRCGVQQRKYNAAYRGTKTCSSAQLLGGGMACKYGCFGYGDCAEACPFDAIISDGQNVPEIDLNKCTGCGICVKECPRDIIVLKELLNDRVVYVGCSNKDLGKDTRKACDAGCISCAICVKKGPQGSFYIEDNLSSVIKQNNDISIEEIKCPTGCIYENRK
ncbi:MAG: RnfABCDGE type electron transport complex subunit B [Elusimicrobiota bacterium]